MKREMQNKIFKMNSEMHKTQKEIDELQKQLREIDIEIAEKVRMNQDKMIESAKIEMAVNNLYRMVIESKGKNVKDTSKAANQEQQPKMSLFEDITQKLEDIQDRMVELKWLFKAAKDPKEDAKVKKTT
jgi:chromosome segregation ATPase